MSTEHKTPTNHPGPDTVEGHSKVEFIKVDSRFLRGDIETETAGEADHYTEASVQLLKHHGMYQQDDRDRRAAMRAAGEKGKAYMMMLRTRIPGGKMTAKQFVAELDICDELGDGTMRLTSRQAVQHHGILKGDLKESIRRINQARLSTLGACGDVNRNVMCSPLPIDRPCYHQVQEMADTLSTYFLPQSAAYFEIWLKDMDSEEKERISAIEGPEHEPIYGATYLPRKFKTGIAFPFDNSIDVLTNDLALVAIVENDQVVGYNVYVGGGMGMTPAKKTTFAALAEPLCYVTVDQAVAVSRAVVEVQRDFGNRDDRKHARLKYLIRDWGIERFRETVAQYYGSPLTALRDDPIAACVDPLGWIDQEDGKWCYGLNIESGRVKDTDEFQLKTALRKICNALNPEIRLTAHQSLLFCNLEESQKPILEQLLADHKVKRSENFSTLRHWSIACVAWPTCSLAITESERALPGMLDQLEVELESLGLQDEAINIRMTGCPNGCARPYNAEIGLVGKAKEKYTMYLGGSPLGTRLATIYKDLVPAESVVPEIVKILRQFAANREPNEAFGDYCDRIGNEALAEQCG